MEVMTPLPLQLVKAGCNDLHLPGLQCDSCRLDTWKGLTRVTAQSMVMNVSSAYNLSAHAPGYLLLSYLLLLK